MLSVHGLALTNGPDRLEAVHLRHLHIHEHHVEVTGLERRDRLAAIGGDHHRMAHALEHAAGHLLVHGMVLGQQDAQSSVGGSWWVRAILGLLPHRESLVARVGKGHHLHQGVEQLGLPHRLGQAGGDVEGLESMRYLPAGRRRSRAAAGHRRSPARLGSAWPSSSPSISGIIPSISAMVIRFASRRGGSQGSQCRRPVRHGNRPRAPARHDLVENQAVGGVVVHDQDRQPFQPANVRFDGTRCVLGLHAQHGRERESAAPARLALDPDTSPHQLHQLGRDRQPEPRAAEPAGR